MCTFYKFNIMFYFSLSAKYELRCLTIANLRAVYFIKLQNKHQACLNH